MLLTAVLTAGTGVALSAVGGVLLAGPAQAHTSLVSSAPSSGAVLEGPVPVVTLVFSRPVLSRQAQVVVTGPDGAAVAGGPAQVSGGTVRWPVGPWPTSGAYRLAYRVLAEDGHPITGEVPFRVSPAVAPTPTAAPPPGSPAVTGSASAPASSPGPPATPLVPALASALAAVAVLLVVGGVRAGRRAGLGR
jgi:hypothetical protein